MMGWYFSEGGFSLSEGFEECRRVHVPPVGDAIETGFDDFTGENTICAFMTGEEGVAIFSLA